MPTDEIAISSSSKAKKLNKCSDSMPPTNQLNYISEINQNSCDNAF